MLAEGGPGLICGSTRVGIGEMKASFIKPPVALTIAGSDCSAGAGIQVDLKTFTSMGVYGLTAVTCVVAETPLKVAKIQAMDLEVIESQIQLLLKAYPIRAIKTGMLWSAETVRLVARLIEAIPDAKKPWLVVDPVMISTSGTKLVADEAIEAYQKELLPLAHLITPNLSEAEALTGLKVKSLKQMKAAGIKLANEYECAVLMKGGHLAGKVAVDLLGSCDEPEGEEFQREYQAPFIDGVSTHGTGCCYSAAITALLAGGLPLEDAVAKAKDWITYAIKHSARWGKVQALNPFPRYEDMLGNFAPYTVFPKK